MKNLIALTTSLCLALAAFLGVMVLVSPLMAAPQTGVSEVTDAPVFSRQSPLPVAWRTDPDGSSQLVISTSLWYRQDQGAWTSAALTPSTELSGTFLFEPGSDGRYAFTTVAYTVTPVAPALSFAGDMTTTYDTVAPTVALTVPNYISATVIPLRWSLDDALSGILSYTVAYSGAGSTWQLWDVPVSQTLVITEFVAAPDTCYDFRLQAYDRAGNTASVRRRTCVGPLQLFLPLVLRNYINIPLRNGGFESGTWNPWVAISDPLPAQLVQDAGAALAGQWSALLGDPSLTGDGDVPPGHAHLAQRFSVPQEAGSVVVTVHYHIISQDVVRSPATSNYLDTFEIYLNTFPLDANTPSKDDPLYEARCVTSLGEPAAQPSDGLVFCAGRVLTTDPQDLGWRSVALDLSAYKGDVVTLYLASFSRRDNWKNTYTYVDEVQTSW